MRPPRQPRPAMRRGSTGVDPDRKLAMGRRSWRARKRRNRAAWTGDTVGVWRVPEGRATSPRNSDLTVPAGLSYSCPTRRFHAGAVPGGRMAVVRSMDASDRRHLRRSGAGAGAQDLDLVRADGRRDRASGIFFRGTAPNRMMRFLTGPALGHGLSSRGVPREVERRVAVRGRRRE
jgi:hypothetical protein